MPFNYQTLKNITNASIIDGTLTASDLQDGSIDASKIQSGVIGSAELATNAVDVSTSTVTGTLTVAAGGLNLGSFGGANRALQSNGSSLSWENHGVQSMQVWTGGGTWTRPVLSTSKCKYKQVPEVAAATAKAAALADMLKDS